MAEFWDWATGDDRVTVMAVTRESYGTDNPDVLGDVRHYIFGQDDFSWRQQSAQAAAERLCILHNEAVEANDINTLALCDLIAGGGVRAEHQ